MISLPQPTKRLSAVLVSFEASMSLVNAGNRYAEYHSQNHLRIPRAMF